MTSPTRARPWRDDVLPSLTVLAWSVLLGAPVGLLWSALAPRLTVSFDKDGPAVPGIESTKAFIGTDGTYLLLVFAAGLVCGTLAWLFARRSGPWTVVALAVGGLLAAYVAARVGVVPGSHDAILALRQGKSGHPPVELYLGQLHGDLPHLRSGWYPELEHPSRLWSFGSAAGWPVGALVAFLAGALRRPEELDA